MTSDQQGTSRHTLNRAEKAGLSLTEKEMGKRHTFLGAEKLPTHTAV